MAKSESPSTAGSAGPDPADDVENETQTAGSAKDGTSGKDAGTAKDGKPAKTTTKAETSTKAGETEKSAKSTKSEKSTKAGKSGASSSRSGNPAKSGRSAARISKRQEKQAFQDPTAGPTFSVRAGLSLLLVLAGIAWIAFYYVAVRPDPATGADPTGPGFMGDLAGWNYLIGFVAFFLGLILAAHPSTPLGRGRGVVTGMLFCFLFGLAWICTFYAVTANPDAIPVFNDLGQKNLFVGIAAMGVGFVYATRWE